MGYGELIPGLWNESDEPLNEKNWLEELGEDQEDFGDLLMDAFNRNCEKREDEVIAYVNFNGAVSVVLIVRVGGGLRLEFWLALSVRRC